MLQEVLSILAGAHNIFSLRVSAWEAGQGLHSSSIQVQPRQNWAGPGLKLNLINAI